MNLDGFIERHRLPDAFRATAERCYVPAALWLLDEVRDFKSRRPDSAYVLGVNGAQGTGKSTLAELLAEWLESEAGLRVAVLSIDDIYLTRHEREELAESVHPLLITRGVPGTHDLQLGLDTLESLTSLAAGETTSVPRFDKSIDDRSPRQDWPTIEGPVDLVILEGWCVGSEPSPFSESLEPVNDLERLDDPDARWRAWVDTRLRADYGALFQKLNALLLLKAPDFECVYRWRLEQEEKLRV